MDDPGETLLADAALALDQDAESRGRKLDRGLKGLVQSGVVSDDIVFVLKCL